eukprot:CAMPEP_0115858036 /NCGR_PEP_ID=MMETSP0287-20121206/15887_1 /TAXON_ID=412157 /ORGANISM="Chrysochromulina rotalis, Strain UIO044" /LENGTH=355 /DNA_ID=CAMNT_0003312281 /DNA_START=70 /DNA_END=1137 /DNA_ORIENTATION=-
MTALALVHEQPWWEKPSSRPHIDAVVRRTVQRGCEVAYRAQDHPDYHSVVEEFERLEGLEELELQPNVTAEVIAALKGWELFKKRVRDSFLHHREAVALHSSYVAALAARNGLRLWRGRTLVAMWLVRLRLTAFTSEVGESLRPLVQPWKVKLAYVVSWTYVILDVLIRTADEMSLRGHSWRAVRTLLFFSTFHSIATMLLPAYCIHTAVHQAQLAVAHFSARAAWLQRSELLRVWTPTALGLLLIPLMPLLDEPMEHLLESGFGFLWPLPRALSSVDGLTDYHAATLAEEVASLQAAKRMQALEHDAFAQPRDGSLEEPPKFLSKHVEAPELERATGLGEPEYQYVPPGILGSA